MLIRGLALALFYGALVWVFYMAIEPYYRRTWPRQLVAWVRLFDGRFRDPLVGRDLLIGCLAGVWVPAVRSLMFVAVAENGLSEIPPRVAWGDVIGVAPVEGLGLFVATTAILTSVGIMNQLIGLVTLVVLRMTLRHTAAAVIGIFAILAFGGFTVALNPLVVVPLSLVPVAIAFFVLFRFGVLAAVVSAILNQWLLRFTLTADLNSWYLSNTIFVALLIGGIATYGFYTSLAGRAVFGDEEEEVPAVA